MLSIGLFGILNPSLFAGVKEGGAIETGCRGIERDFNTCVARLSSEIEQFREIERKSQFVVHD